MKPASLLTGLMLGLLVSVASQVQAHDAIGAEARKAYLQKLESLSRTAQSEAPPAARAAALVDAGRTLDEIRTLLNEDIISHGRTQGLETSILVDQLNATPWRLQVSPQTRLFLANQRPYRDALALDARGKHVPLARFMLMKNQFYDSFTDDPLKPIGQDARTLQDMIDHGERLLNVRDPAVDSEEVHFILAIHYLQAQRAGVVPAARCQSRFAALLKTFRERWPSSLKLATLEALSGS